MGLLVGLSALGVVACSDDGSLEGNGTSQPAPTPDGGSATNTVQAIEGVISASRTLAAGNDYVLAGLVRVASGATLTIEKGVTIRGKLNSKAILLIEPGAKIIAEGTKDEPIVFTSEAAPEARRAGTWGGIVILGNAPVNFEGGKGNVEGLLANEANTTYGGSDENDSSGVLRYVRIEYAGYQLTADNEVNGLTFAGVGRGTKVDHIQVRHALDDCFEFFGGTVDAKYLICHYNQDDGFDTDNGYRGRLQFLVLQQDPAHPGEDNGFESDNDVKGTVNEPLTNPTVFNATLCGKNKDPEGAQFGALLRRNTRGTYTNILFQGFEANIDIRDTNTAEAAAAPNAFPFRSTIFGSTLGAAVVGNIAYPETSADKNQAPNYNNDGAFDEVLFAQKPEFNNSTAGSAVDCFSPTAPKFGPAASLTAGAATPPNDGFFDTTANYIGAFKDVNDTWATSGNWVVWDLK